VKDASAAAGEVAVTEAAGGGVGRRLVGGAGRWLAGGGTGGGRQEAVLGGASGGMVTRAGLTGPGLGVPPGSTRKNSLRAQPDP
jgi:hypothetical protein